MIYVTSDLHFYYASDPKVGKRRFQTAEEKNEFLVRQWNETVGEDDEVYLLGDVSDGNGEETGRILARLNGRKYLIIGNHDKYLDDPAFDPRLYVWTRQYYELRYQGEKFVLFHYPIEAWSGYLKDRIHLHGHLHRLEPVCEPIRRYEVGVDAHDGKPVSIDEVWERVRELHNCNRRVNGVWG